MQVLRASNAKVWGAFLCGSTKTTKHSDWDLPFPSGVMKHLPTTWSDVAVVTASKETHKKTSLYPVPESIQILIIQLNCRFCLTSFIQPDIDYIFIHTQFLYWIINFCQTHWELEIKCWPPHGWAGPSLHCLPERLHHLPPEDPPTRLPPSDAEIERERERKRGFQNWKEIGSLLYEEEITEQSYQKITFQVWQIHRYSLIVSSLMQHWPIDKHDTCSVVHRPGTSIN